MAEDNNTIQLIINQLKHDDCQVRATAMEKLKVIGVALGPDRTKSDFIPFLKGSFRLVFF